MSDENADQASAPPAPVPPPARVPIVAPAPHVATEMTSRQIMLWVIGALAPAGLWAMWSYMATDAALGIRALITLVVAVGSCVATEAVWNMVTKKKQSIGDFSAVITGLLIAMSIPPLTPWWITLAGGIVAIGLAKMLFGGLGFNLFNPALVGRAVVLMSWLGVMSDIKPFPGGWFSALKLPAVGKFDAINGATRLALASADRAAHGAYHYSLTNQYGPLLFKNLEGSVGEVSAALLILGGVVLILKGIIDWRIPLGYIGTVALLAWLFGSDPIFNVLAGGILLGAFFMATDYVTSPVTKNGRLVFGIGCGLFNITTRFFGPMPETTTFAILFMNGLAPLIDRMFMPKPFGWQKPAKEAKANA